MATDYRSGSNGFLDALDGLLALSALPVGSASVYVTDCLSDGLHVALKPSLPSQRGAQRAVEVDILRQDLVCHGEIPGVLAQSSTLIVLHRGTSRHRGPSRHRGT